MQIKQLSNVHVCARVQALTCEETWGDRQPRDGAKVTWKKTKERHEVVIVCMYSCIAGGLVLFIIQGFFYSL